LIFYYIPNVNFVSGYSSDFGFFVLVPVNFCQQTKNGWPDSRFENRSSCRFWKDFKLRSFLGLTQSSKTSKFSLTLLSKPSWWCC